MVMPPAVAVDEVVAGGEPGDERLRRLFVPDADIEAVFGVDVTRNAAKARRLQGVRLHHHHVVVAWHLVPYRLAEVAVDEDVDAVVTRHDDGVAGVEPHLPGRACRSKWSLRRFRRRRMLCRHLRFLPGGSFGNGLRLPDGFALCFGNRGWRGPRLGRHDSFRRRDSFGRSDQGRSDARPIPGIQITRRASLGKNAACLRLGALLRGNDPVAPFAVDVHGHHAHRHIEAGCDSVPLCLGHAGIDEAAEHHARPRQRSAPQASGQARSGAAAAVAWHSWIVRARAARREGDYRLSRSRFRSSAKRAASRASTPRSWGR